MRLINAVNLQLEGPFYNTASRPKYAILSHTWGDEELSMQDMATASKQIYKAGFKKIVSCAARAQQDGLTHIWVDTVCIDKTSSAELSEAINSMYRWYEKADVCYVVLEDFKAEKIDDDEWRTLEKCRWFTRGWTLQELIAPGQVLFFNQRWQMLGSKASVVGDDAKVDVTERLARITGVDKDTLRGASRRRVCVAARMSWAAKRTTTREEDMAYCLLGLFDINMPLLYGEGDERAFLRLQEEILRRTEDQTILAWTAPGQQDDKPRYTVDASDLWSLLAPSPAYFAECASIRASAASSSAAAPESIRVTSRGISVRVLKLSRDSRNGAELALLACRSGTINSEGGEDSLALSLLRLGMGDEVYARGPAIVHVTGALPSLDKKPILVPYNLRNRDEFCAENLVDFMRITRSSRFTELYSTNNSIRFISASRPPNTLQGPGWLIRLSPLPGDHAVVFLHFVPPDGARGDSATTSPSPRAPAFTVAIYCRCDQLASARLPGESHTCRLEVYLKKTPKQLVDDYKRQRRPPVVGLLETSPESLSTDESSILRTAIPKRRRHSAETAPIDWKLDDQHTLTMTTTKATNPLESAFYVTSLDVTRETPRREPYTLPSATKSKDHGNTSILQRLKLGR